MRLCGKTTGGAVVGDTGVDDPGVGDAGADDAGAGDCVTDNLTHGQAEEPLPITFH
ncbi:hypothetical protein GCM10018987_69020 [Streptomyces cremeus]